MASCSLLRNHFLPFSTVILVLLSGLFLYSCGASSKATNNTPSQPEANQPAPGDVVPEISNEMVTVIQSTRSQLRDVYATQRNELPATFNQQAAREIGDPTQGFRIQILSTRDVAAADSIAQEFQTWAETTMPNYIPKAYVLYQQPYYKVHVGNFQFQDQAQLLTQRIKERYPDAWVVYDEVEPDLVPKQGTFNK